MGGGLDFANIIFSPSARSLLRQGCLKRKRAPVWSMPPHSDYRFPFGRTLPRFDSERTPPEIAYHGPACVRFSFFARFLAPGRSKLSLKRMRRERKNRSTKYLILRTVGGLLWIFSLYSSFSLRAPRCLTGAMQPFLHIQFLSSTSRFSLFIIMFQRRVSPQSPLPFYYQASLKKCRDSVVVRFVHREMVYCLLFFCVLLKHHRIRKIRKQSCAEVKARVRKADSFGWRFLIDTKYQHK